MPWVMGFVFHILKEENSHIMKKLHIWNRTAIGSWTILTSVCHDMKLQHQNASFRVQSRLFYLLQKMNIIKTLTCDNWKENFQFLICFTFRITLPLAHVIMIFILNFMHFCAWFKVDNRCWDDYVNDCFIISLLWPGSNLIS